MTGSMQVSIAASLVGGLAIWLRAAMLKPAARGWVTAPGVVSLALAGLGILMVVMAVGLARVRGRVSYDELVWWLSALASANAIAGLVLLVNLWIQHRRPPAPTPQREHHDPA